MTSLIDAVVVSGLYFVWKLTVQSQRVLAAGNLLHKSLAIAYSLLLGLVLPFICWGTLATPGHPHRMAHLVFFLPPAYTTVAVKNAEIDHSLHLREHGTQDGLQTSPATQPIGRSVPAQLTSAMSIISPLFLAQALLVFSPKQVVLHLSQENNAHLFDPRVLTPPPRTLYL